MIPLRLTTRTAGDDQPLRASELARLWQALPPAQRVQLEAGLAAPQLHALGRRLGRADPDIRPRIKADVRSLDAIWKSLPETWRYSFGLSLTDATYDKLLTHQLTRRALGPEPVREEFVTDAETARAAINHLSALVFELDREDRDEAGGAALLRGQGIRLSVVYSTSLDAGLLTIEAPEGLLPTGRRWLDYAAQMSGGRLDSPAGADLAHRLAFAGEAPHERRQYLFSHFRQVKKFATEAQAQAFEQRLAAGDFDGAAQALSRAQVRRLRQLGRAFLEKEVA